MTPQREFEFASSIWTRYSCFSNEMAEDFRAMKVICNARTVSLCGAIDVRKSGGVHCVGVDQLLLKHCLAMAAAVDFFN